MAPEHTVLRRKRDRSRPPPRSSPKPRGRRATSVPACDLPELRISMNRRATPRSATCWQRVTSPGQQAPRCSRAHARATLSQRHESDHGPRRQSRRPRLLRRQSLSPSVHAVSGGLPAPLFARCGQRALTRSGSAYSLEVPYCDALPAEMTFQAGDGTSGSRICDANALSALTNEAPGSGLRGPMPKQECSIRVLVRCDAVAGAGVVYRALGLPEC